MDNIILSQVPLPELMELIESTVQEAIKKALTNIPTGQPESQSNPASIRPLTTKQLCEYLGVTEPTISKWKTKGVIPYFQIGTSTRYDLNKVLKALEKQNLKKN